MGVSSDGGVEHASPRVDGTLHVQPFRSIRALIGPLAPSWSGRPGWLLTRQQAMPEPCPVLLVTDVTFPLLSASSYVGISPHPMNSRERDRVQWMLYGSGPKGRSYDKQYMFVSLSI